MTFRAPEAFRASLEARIRSASLARHVPSARVRQLLVFDRFLARVFAVFGDRVVAKGGAVLELRIERARTTRDIDPSSCRPPPSLRSDALAFVFFAMVPAVVGAARLFALGRSLSRRRTA